MTVLPRFVTDLYARLANRHKARDDLRIAQARVRFARALYVECEGPHKDTVDNYHSLNRDQVEALLMLGHKAHLLNNGHQSKQAISSVVARLLQGVPGVQCPQQRDTFAADVSGAIQHVFAELNPHGPTPEFVDTVMSLLGNREPNFGYLSPTATQHSASTMPEVRFVKMLTPSGWQAVVVQYTDDHSVPFMCHIVALPLGETGIIEKAAAAA